MHRHSLKSVSDDELLGRLVALLKDSRWIEADLVAHIAEVDARRLDAREGASSMFVYFAQTSRPRKTVADSDTKATARRIPAAVRRAVHDRDGGRCTYRGRRGRRCSRRHDVEYHHRVPFGKGGDHRVQNLALMCRTHNALLAEHDYGKEVMARHRRASRASDQARVGRASDSRQKTLAVPPPG